MSYRETEERNDITDYNLRIGRLKKLFEKLKENHSNSAEEITILSEILRVIDTIKNQYGEEYIEENGEKAYAVLGSYMERIQEEIIKKMNIMYEEKNNTERPEERE